MLARPRLLAEVTEGSGSTAFRLDLLAAPEHPLHSTQIPAEILAVAEEINALSDSSGIEKDRLEFLIRVVLFFGRKVATKKKPPKK